MASRSSKIDAAKIWAEVKENQAKLRACEGPHDFELIESYAGGVPRTYRCAKCGGTLDSINVNWYNDGLRDGLKARRRRKIGK